MLPVAFVQDVHAIGLQAAQGALMSLDFYWDQTDATRAFAKRFFGAIEEMPSRNHALVYSAATHVMKGAQKAGSRDGDAIAAAMHAMPVEDFFTHGARIRADGKLMRDMYLFEVKKPDKSRYAWDYLRQLAVIPADRAFRPLRRASVRSCGTRDPHPTLSRRERVFLLPLPSGEGRGEGSSVIVQPQPRIGPLHHRQLPGRRQRDVRRAHVLPPKQIFVG